MQKIPDGKDTNVPSKTPEEIKKSIEILRFYAQGATDAYVTHLTFGGKADQEQEDYIKALDDGANALAYIEQLERERDAAIEQLKEFDCATCKHSDLEHIASVCCKCKDASEWKWRGVKENKDENA